MAWIVGAWFVVMVVNMLLAGAAMREALPPKPPPTDWWGRHSWWLTAGLAFAAWFVLAHGQCARLGCG